MRDNTTYFFLWICLFTGLYLDVDATHGKNSLVRKYIFPEFWTKMDLTFVVNLFLWTPQIYRNMVMNNVNNTPPMGLVWSVSCLHTNLFMYNFWWHNKGNAQTVFFLASTLF